MYKKIFSAFLMASMFVLFSSCDYSKKIRQNETDIAQLKGTVRLLKESVANYERAVKKLDKEIEALKKPQPKRR